MLIILKEMFQENHNTSITVSLQHLKCLKYYRSDNFLDSRYRRRQVNFPCSAKTALVTQEIRTVPCRKGFSHIFFTDCVTSVLYIWLAGSFISFLGLIFRYTGYIWVLPMSNTYTGCISVLPTILSNIDKCSRYTL